MNNLRALGIGTTRLSRQEGTNAEHVQVKRPLQRVLDFTGQSIDDLVNSEIAKRKVLSYFKLHKWVQRESEISELERQWNRR